MRSARLFAAVKFTPAEKKQLSAAAEHLRNGGAAGRFAAPELLHITLHFFGQTPLDKLGAIETAMGRAAAFSPFTLATGRAGTFGRSNASVLWLGLGEGEAELKALQAALEKSLQAEGFATEARAYQAHITLARDARCASLISEIELPAVRLAVGGITLMESTQTSGRLEYTPLLEVPFQQ
jgi:RNA 2',3'-cyclic 3'-phosphodiesterase